jgi:tetratricopeptide (TPR) repeat protein
LPAGEYNLRLAAVDASGHAGSVDHPFAVALAAGDGITMGDLLLLHAAKVASDGLSVVADGRVRAGSVETHVETIGRAGTAPPTVTFGVAERPDGPLLVQAAGVVSKRDAKGLCTADGRLDLRLLPPGDYVAVAVVNDGKRKLGTRHAPLHVEAPPAASATAAGAAPAPRVPFAIGASSGLVKPFASADVLAPATLTYFAGRLQAADRKPSAAATAALAALRGGRLDGVLEALGSASSDTLSVAFLKGLGLLAKGDLEPAAREFRQAVRIADDFLPAAFYLGACYAAGGRDQEAAGAWQTALVTESDARIVYDVLADALLRVDDGERALEVLEEARGRWPDDEAFLPRLAVGQAMLDRRPEALATLGRYLERHQADAEAVALAVRLIYEARIAGQPLVSAESDLELARKYAEWYRTAGGPNQALVDRWVAFIGKK